MNDLAELFRETVFSGSLLVALTVIPVLAFFLVGAPSGALLGRVEHGHTRDEGFVRLVDALHARHLRIGHGSAPQELRSGQAFGSGGNQVALARARRFW